MQESCHEMPEFQHDIYFNTFITFLHISCKQKDMSYL